MASISELTINVGISISRDTVDRCLSLLSIYLTDNPDLDIRSFEFHEAEGIKRRAELFRRSTAEMRGEEDEHKR